MTNSLKLKAFSDAINDVKTIRASGKVIAIKGIIIECVGLESYVTIGSHCFIEKNINNNSKILAEVVGIKDNIILMMPFGDTDGIGNGSNVAICNQENIIWPDQSWKGRVIDAFARPIDEKSLLAKGKQSYSLKNQPLNPQKRNRLGDKIDLGIKAIDCFTSCVEGQRMGVFAGSGIGKSVLISMITNYANTDVKVIGLIGERGREVQEFIHEYLGEEGLKQAIIIVATSDEPALMRKRAAYLTVAIAEYFRDQGLHVLCIIDSITRLAMAQREIGLAVGEPPTSKGYTPSVFSELPKLLERTGPGIGAGNITGLFTVLVEGDDHNEPISDCVRGTIDGHIVLDRAIADRGRYPAVNILRSVSRALPKCNTDRENAIIQKAKYYVSTYYDMAEIIRIGAYKKGSDIEVDKAIHYQPLIEEFLKQAPNEHSPISESFNQLANILELE